MSVTNADRQLEAVITEIESAFAGVEIKGGTTLHEAEAIDRGLSDDERLKARIKDTAKRWADVPEKDIENHPEALSFLDAPGYRFYLPAYMIWSLKNYRISGSLSSDYTIYSLAPDNKAKDNAWKLKRFRTFTPAQGRAIFRFLKFMAECTDGYADDFAAKTAMDGYWKQYAGNDS